MNFSSPKFALTIASGLLWTACTFAQTYPTKPIRLIVTAPAGSVSDIRARWTVVGKILKTPEARDWFAEQGGEPVGDTPEEFAAFIKFEHARWGPIIREAGIRAD